MDKRKRPYMLWGLFLLILWLLSTLYFELRVIPLVKEIDEQLDNSGIHSQRKLLEKLSNENFKASHNNLVPYMIKTESSCWMPIKEAPIMTENYTEPKCSSTSDCEVNERLGGCYTTENQLCCFCDCKYLIEKGMKRCLESVDYFINTSPSLNVSVKFDFYFGDDSLCDITIPYTSHTSFWNKTVTTITEKRNYKNLSSEPLYRTKTELEKLGDEMAKYDCEELAFGIRNDLFDDCEGLSENQARDIFLLKRCDVWR